MMDGKVWMYVRWIPGLKGLIASASTNFWDEYFAEDYNPLRVVRVEAREVVR